jgi:hypothetical protein
MTATRGEVDLSGWVEPLPRNLKVLGAGPLAQNTDSEVM